MKDNEFEQQEIEKQKDIPAVGKSSKSSQWVGITVLVVVVGLVSYGFLSGGKESKKDLKEDTNYQTASRSNNQMFKRTEPKPEKKQNNKAKLTRDDVLARLAEEKRILEMQQEAKALAEAQILENEKRKSSIKIQSSGSFQRQATQGNNAYDQNGLTDLKQEPKEGELLLGNPKRVDSSIAVQITNMSKMIGAGKFIKGVLETAIDSTLPGQVRAVVSADVYSSDGQNILIEKGSRLVGQYQSGIRQGQNRVFVIWSHVTTPQGFQIGLESSGVNSLGTTGLSGEYDSHFLKRFGGALLLSVIEQYGESNNDVIDINGGNSLQRASGIALDNAINIPPTIYVDQGEVINVFVARDLRFDNVL